MNSNTDQQATAQGLGYLIVQVTTANSAIPLANAAVTVRDSESGTVLFELRSGKDGRTDRIPLQTPPKSISQSPSQTHPFALYSVDVSLPLYEGASYQNLPIFDGITSIQQADLRPIPENGYPDGFTLNGMRQGEIPLLWRG